MLIKSQCGHDGILKYLKWSHWVALSGSSSISIIEVLINFSKGKMLRIAIIGNAGGGKSVLARKLGDALDLPVYHFDDLQWQPRWTRKPEEEIRETHDNWVDSSGWIIDGWGSWSLLGQRFEVADTILFVDFPILIHYWWAAKRQFKALLKSDQGWPPEGCLAFPVTGRLFKLIWYVHTEMRPHLVELIDQYAKDTRIVHLKSPHAMNLFLSTIQSSAICNQSCK